MIDPTKQYLVVGVRGLDSEEIQRRLIDDGWQWLSGAKRPKYIANKINLLVPDSQESPKVFSKTSNPELHRRQKIRHEMTAKKFLELLKSPKQLMFDFF